MARRVLSILLLWGAFVGFANGFASLASSGHPCHAPHHHRAPPAEPAR